jgi:hypothetical protein
VKITDNAEARRALSLAEKDGKRVNIEDTEIGAQGPRREEWPRYIDVTAVTPRAPL